MACETYFKRNQTIAQRKEEVRKVVETLDRALASGRVKIKIDKSTGAISFEGLTATERDDVTDACAYRRLMISGSAAAKMAIQRAEQLAGRGVSRQALAAGIHSHDGGKSWHTH